MNTFEFCKHRFHSLETIPFNPQDYSSLKFGDNNIATFYGAELATVFFEKYADYLISNGCVVIPSPYNEVKNAATIMTKYFVRELNRLLVDHAGKHVDTSIIHRKVSYINDYGFLSKDARMNLIANDQFYLNTEFYGNKMLVLLDDVKITGTHEETMHKILHEKNIHNDVFFGYYGIYTGEDPTIESKINFAGINNLESYRQCLIEDDNHVIVRTIKYFLTIPNLEDFIEDGDIPYKKLQEIYYGALSEGYYTIPAYQKNFQIVSNYI